MIGKQKMNLPSARAMSAAIAEVRAIQNKHDARLMLMVFLDRAALFASNLKAAGLETDDSLKAMFDSALASSKKPRKPPTMTTPTGQTASERAS